MGSFYEISEENRNLARFEIKGPDYDLIERPVTVSPDKVYGKKRYTRQGEIWTSQQEERSRARIMFAGDITCFGKQFDAAQTDSGYDFNYVFDVIRPIFASANLVVGNLETMIVPNAPYRSEKRVSEQNYHCNAPIEFLEAIRDGGFDMLTNANNHDLDTGAVGIGETIDYVERMGVIQTGTFKRDKKRYELINVCGFRVAITAFATEYNNKLQNLTEAGGAFLLNTYSRESAASIAKQAREDGAELLFACIHWGVEHKLNYNESQTRTAKALAEVGYDCIIGSHPHVLQPFARIQHGGKTVPVFYSMGNFVSHNVGNARARSMIACVDLIRKDGAIDLECSYLPVYTARSVQGRKYPIVPIGPDAKEKRNLQIRSMIVKAMGKELLLTTDITFQETVQDPREVQEKAPKVEKPDLSTAKEFPIVYSTGGFQYHVYPDHACLQLYDGKAGSTAIPETILDVPVTEIAPCAFAGNPVLGKLNLNTRLTTVSREMMRGCAELEGFRLGSNIREIQELAFADCPRLTAAVMRKKVQRICSGAFRNCPNLRSAKIPPNVTDIADDAFEGCGQLKIYCESGSYAEQYAISKGISYAYMKL